jgi:hypothetical protein
VSNWIAQDYHELLAVDPVRGAEVRAEVQDRHGEAGLLVLTGAVEFDILPPGPRAWGPGTPAYDTATLVREARTALSEELAESSAAIVPGHPRWREFCELLAGPEGCDFTDDPPGSGEKFTWRCGGGTDLSRSKRILEELMGEPPARVTAALVFYSQHGGHCDCEVLFNVDPGEEQGGEG